MEQIEKTLQIPTNYISKIFGKLDENIKIIERAFSVEIINRESILRL